MGRTYTVRALAKVAGISVRALHHYDAIGLLKPAFTGQNRYRHYGEAELLRLQQILIHRALDLPLARIAGVLDAQGPDRIATLQAQRDRLDAEARRYAGMVRTIERTIARLNGELDMKDDELYSGIVPPEKQKAYEEWLVERHGDAARERIAQGRKAMGAMNAAERAESMRELAAIEGGLVAKLREGVAAEDAALDPLVARHRDWVARGWGRPCPPAAYAGLAEVYRHPDFEARYEALAPGFTDYLIAAMRGWAGRQGAAT